MDKEETLQDFLKIFRISLKNSSIYFKNHPLLKKSAEDLKIKITRLSSFINPIKIGITPVSVVIGGKTLEKTTVYEELAGFFHFRKIQSIEIGENVSVEELIYFLTKVSMPPKEIFKEDGIANILLKEKITSISVKELDYSQILNIEGEEYKDIWLYLFNDTVEKGNFEQIRQLEGNFGKVIRNLKARDIIEDEVLQKNIEKFLAYLDKKKLKECAKDIFNLILKDRSLTYKERLDKLRMFFKNLNSEELTDVLWEEIITNNNFNSLSFDLFSSLTDKIQHNEILSSLVDRIGKCGMRSPDPKVRKKIKELFFMPQEKSSPESYHSTFAILLKEAILKEGAVTEASLDRKLMHINYRSALLNLLMDEKSKERLVAISERIWEEWDDVIKSNDMEFLKEFLEVLRKRESDIYFSNVFNPLSKCISNFIENSILEEKSYFDSEYFINFVKESSQESHCYLNKIFKEDKSNPHILRLFFKFFPESMQNFYINLRKKLHNKAFIKKIIDNISQIDDLLSIEILKYLYNFSSLAQRLEILEAMGRLSARDENFLLSVLKTSEIYLKKSALSILANDEKARQKAAEALFSIFSPLGIQNKILETNIEIVTEKAVKEAKDYLIALSKKRFFWNAALRNKAKEALELLERLNVR